MQMQPFHLFLSWLSVESEERQYIDPGKRDTVDLVTAAMQNVDTRGRAGIVAFIDNQLSMKLGKQELARLFDDGHLYFKWNADDGPRKMLMQIRDAALSAPPRSAAPQPGP